MKTFDQKTKKWVSGVVAVNHDPPHWDEVRASHFNRRGRTLICYVTLLEGRRLGISGDYGPDYSVSPPRVV